MNTVVTGMSLLNDHIVIQLDTFYQESKTIDTECILVPQHYMSDCWYDKSVFQHWLIRKDKRMVNRLKNLYGKDKSHP